MPENQVLEKVNSREQGISSEEAERRLKENGRNVLWERKPKKWFQVFIEQFQDLLVWILLAAAVVSALTDNGESAVVIGAVLTLNAALGTIEHQRAQKSLDSLRALSAPEARVLRDGARERLSCWKPGIWFRRMAGCWKAAVWKWMKAPLRENQQVQKKTADRWLLRIFLWLPEKIWCILARW